MKGETIMSSRSFAICVILIFAFFLWADYMVHGSKFGSVIYVIAAGVMLAIDKLFISKLRDPFNP